MKPAKSRANGHGFDHDQDLCDTCSIMFYAPMNDWRVFVKETQALLSQKSYFQAEIKIKEGLFIYPYQASLLSVASAV